MRRTISIGKRRARSCSSMTGATSVSMKSRIVSRRRTCSGERSRSIGASVAPRDSAPRTTGASLRPMREPASLAAAHDTASPGRSATERPARARRACGATCSSGSASTARARPTSSPTGSARAGPASCSSSGRSRPRTSSAARPSATASAGRATCTTSRPTPRTFSRRTTTRWRPGCWRRSRRSVATTCSSRSSRRAGASSATGSASRWPSASPPDAPLADRVRELAVIQAEQGYLAEADPRAPTARSACASTTARSTTSPRASPAACQAELDLFREVLGADVVREPHIASGDRCCSYRIARPARLTRRRTAACGQASSRSTATRDAGSSRGAGTSLTFGTNDAASDVAAATSWSSTDRIPSRPSWAISSRM